MPLKNGKLAYTALPVCMEYKCMDQSPLNVDMSNNVERREHIQKRPAATKKPAMSLIMVSQIIPHYSFVHE